jgi:prepilin-type N-terminal cleavage/methylation domain-containing protein
MRTARPGITLLEVLVALFVMGIGLLALLALFPLGAVNMAQALRNDRAASAANLASEQAEAMGLRHDPNVTSAFAQASPKDRSGPSVPVFVDGLVGRVTADPVGGQGATLIPRVQPTYTAGQPAGVAARWFSLLDDVSFGPNAAPEGGVVQRGGRYTWAYLLRRPRYSQASVVELTVVVYSGRDTGVAGGETLYPALGGKGSNNLTLSYAGQAKPALRRNAWVLDVTPDGTTGLPLGQFYRVVNVAEKGAGELSLEVEAPLKANVTSVVVMDNAIEVFEKGSGWRP